MDFNEIFPWDASCLGRFLICPRCHDENVHLRQLSQAEREPDGSLTYVTLSFECEQGHGWDLIATEDHGHVYVDVRGAER